MNRDERDQWDKYSKFHCSECKEALSAYQTKREADQEADRLEEQRLKNEQVRRASASYLQSLNLDQDRRRRIEYAVSESNFRAFMSG